jgi:hypothetical protein
MCPLPQEPRTWSKTRAAWSQLTLRENVRAALRVCNVASVRQVLCLTLVDTLSELSKLPRLHTIDLGWGCHPTNEFFM